MIIQDLKETIAPTIIQLSYFCGTIQYRNFVQFVFIEQTICNDSKVSQDISQHKSTTVIKMSDF